jgi:hypothetical protein
MELMSTGGISYFSRKYGWACDNIRNYEVRKLLPDIKFEIVNRWTHMYRSFLGTGPSQISTMTRIPTSTGLSAAAQATSES